jgi:preprotein translocase subunit SecB
MDAARQPGLLFDRIFVNRVHFAHRSPPTSVIVEPEQGHLQLEARVSETQDHRAGLLLVCLRTDPSDTRSNYELDIEMGAIARTAEGEENLPPAEYLKNVGVPMILPFLREFVANLTIRARSGPIWLRPVNVQALQAAESASEVDKDATKRITERPKISSDRGYYLAASHNLGRSTMGKKDVHTVKKTEGQGWVNKVGGKVASQHRTQENASEKGKQIAKANQAEHVIHGRDGRIREKNSYGRDPNPPKDKR